MLVLLATFMGAGFFFRLARYANAVTAGAALTGQTFSVGGKADISAGRDR
jgi:hypothetical protein